jgi:phosphatidylserine/phosphatidylglycerophosphate/cardiolipin synthase-like enzyme
MRIQRAAVGVIILIALAVVVALTSDVTDDLRERGDAPSASDGSGVRGLIVEPDDGRAPLLDELRSADRSIDVMIYLMTDDRIIDALLDAESRGVEVRVLLEHYPFGGYGEPEQLANELLGAGAEVKWTSDSFTFTHAKSIIIDSETVAILNFNLSRSSFEFNREFGVISTFPGDVAEFQAIFDADWQGERFREPDDLIVSPLNSRAEILELFESADRSIDIYAEVVRDRDVIDALERAERNGVEVRIVLSFDAEPDAIRITGELEAAGVEIRYFDELYIHAKAIVVDDEIAFVGSQNFTRTSLDENREVGIIVREAAVVERLGEQFEEDFAIASRTS